MARFIEHEPCPNCGSRDNLARYDDGGAWCFGCHYTERRTHAPMRHMGSTTEDNSGCSYPIPEDIGHEFRSDCVEWLASFHLDIPTAIVNGLVWSPSREQLIYQLGNCWQARNFGERSRAKRKNFTSGDVNECLHIYSAHEAEGVGGTGPARGVLEGKSLTRVLVVVEDPLSAIRVAHSGARNDSLPLLGSHLAQARLNAVARLYSSLVFWLDSDKYKEARAMEQRAKYMGLSARTIYTNEDPKCHLNKEIQEILG